MKTTTADTPTTHYRSCRHRQQDAFALSLALVSSRGGAPLSAPRPLRNTLIVAEADRFDSWRESVSVVLPVARMVEISRMEDLDQSAEVYLLPQRFLPLARPELRLFSGSCPRCGEPIRQFYAGEPQLSHCPGKLRQPANLTTRLAQDLAALLFISHRIGEGSALLPACLPERARHVPVKKVSAAVLTSFESRALGLVAIEYASRLATPGAICGTLTELLSLLCHYAQALGREVEVHAGLEALPQPAPDSFPRAAVFLDRAVSELQRQPSTSTWLESRSVATKLLENLDRQALWEEVPCEEDLRTFAHRHARRHSIVRQLLRRRGSKVGLVIFDDRGERTGTNRFESAWIEPFSQRLGAFALVLGNGTAEAWTG